MESLAPFGNAALFESFGNTAGTATFTSDNEPPKQEV
jgi:hypothetical protein